MVTVFVGGGGGGGAIIAVVGAGVRGGGAESLIPEPGFGVSFGGPPAFAPGLLLVGLLGDDDVVLGVGFGAVEMVGGEGKAGFSGGTAGGGGSGGGRGLKININSVI